MDKTTELWLARHNPEHVRKPMPKIETERRQAILDLIGNALSAADDVIAKQTSSMLNERTGWYSDELCDAHNVIHNLLGEWLRDFEEYLDQRADVDDGRPNAAMRLLTDLRKCFEMTVPTRGPRKAEAAQD